MSLASPTTTVAPGSTIAVTIKEDSGTDLVNSVQAAVNYNPAQLEFVSLTEGSAFPTIAANSTANAGVIRIGRATSTPVSGVQDVVTVNFKVLAASGAVELTMDKGFSFVVRSTDNTDILGIVTGATYIISGTDTGSTATMQLDPATATAAAGSTVSVTVREDSGLTAVNSVQSSVTYNAAQLQYISMSEGNSFTNIAATDTATAGRIRVARSVQTGSAGVSGTNPIVTLTFKVLATSGTSSLAIDKAQSFVVSSATNGDILSTVTGSTVTVTSPPASSGATLSLSPSSGNFTQGSTVSVIVRASSATSALTTVQAAINYPASQLQYVSTTEGSVFTTAQRTSTATAGLIDIIRSIPGGNPGVTGTNPVVTISFKVIGTSGAAALTYATASAVYDDSGTGTNILDRTASTAANYTIASVPTCTANPTTPGSITRTASNYTTVTLAWAASTAGSNCTIAGYHIFRNGAAVGDVTVGTSFSDAGLASGTAYNYSVQSFDTAGHNSATSTAVSITTRLDDMSPTTPEGLTASAPNAVSVNLAWNPSTDFPNPGGVGVAGYRIYRNNSLAPTYTVTSGTAFTDTSVAVGTTYTYVIHAYDNLGNQSAPSSVVSAKTTTPTATCVGNPTVPSALATGAVTMNSIGLSWTASTAATGCTLAGYQIFRNSVNIDSSAITNFTNTGLTANTSYTYAVQAYDTSGHMSPLSTARTIATTADTSAPIAPTGVTASAVSAGQVNLAWLGSTDNVAVVSYKVYRAGVLVATVGSTVRTYNDTQVVANTNYTYTVSAADAAGNESTKTPSIPSPVRTPAAADTTAPTAPSSVRSLTITTSSAIITWNPSTDNTAVSGYHVYRNGVFIGDATTLTYTVTSLTGGTAYTFTVKAFDASGNTSAVSNSLVVSTLNPVFALIGDFNSDSVVDIFDLSIMMSHWQEVNVPVKFGDINRDGKVDVFDLSTLLSNLGDMT